MASKIVDMFGGRETSDIKLGGASLFLGAFRVLVDTLTIAGDSTLGERTLVLVPMGKNSTRVDVEWNFELMRV